MPTDARTTLLAIDQHNSPLNAIEAGRKTAIAYTPYGAIAPGDDPRSQLLFNGEPRDPLTGWYPLGNGYRMYSPLLGRFFCPDDLSPFKAGGLNAYAYCGGDPVNRTDPTGHFIVGAVKFLARKLGLRKSAKVKAAARFNADPRPAKSSTLFADKHLKRYAGLGESKQTAELSYHKDKNKLHLLRTTENDAFSALSATEVSANSVPRRPEQLISITPDLDLKNFNPDTLRYVRDIQENLRTQGALSAKQISKIQHPEVKSALIRAQEFLNAPEKGDPRRFEYRSGVL